MTTIKSIMHIVYCLPFREFGYLILTGTAVFLLLYFATRKRSWQRPALLSLSTIYILMVICATLLWRSESSGAGVSLIPFASYIKYAQGETEMLRESIMNIVFFYPLGLLWGGAATDNQERRKAVFAAFLLSTTVEVCQGCFNLGYAEVDDVIHNTLGAGLGVLATYIAGKAADFVNFGHKYQS